METPVGPPQIPRDRTVLDSWAMDLEFLMASGAPPLPPTAPYSHAVRAGDYLFVTGQMPSDPRTGDRLVPGGIVEQAHQVMNRVYVTYRTPGRLPARTCVGVTGLALDALVEIDLVVKP